MAVGAAGVATYGSVMPRRAGFAWSDAGRSATIPACQTIVPAAAVMQRMRSRNCAPRSLRPRRALRRWSRSSMTCAGPASARVPSGSTPGSWPWLSAGRHPLHRRRVTTTRRQVTTSRAPSGVATAAGTPRADRAGAGPCRPSLPVLPRGDAPHRRGPGRATGRRACPAPGVGDRPAPLRLPAL